jgi:hypothetical protein
MITSNNESVLIRDLSDLTMQIIFNALWTSMNLGSKQPISRDDSRHVPSRLFYTHCGIEETGNPNIICIVYRRLRRHPSEHGTGSVGKYLLATAHIAQLNELTE